MTGGSLGSAEGINHAHWTGWGNARAYARGDLIDGEGFPYPATITAYGLHRCHRCDGRPHAWYEWLHAVSKAGYWAGAERGPYDVTINVTPQRYPTPFFTSGGPLIYARFQRRPPQLVYSGDGNAQLAGRHGIRSRLRWDRWGAREAVGRGDDWHNDCNPDCADGTFYGYPARVRLYRPGHIANRPVFTRMTVTYTGKRPPYPAYRHKSITYKFRCGHTGCQDRFWYP